MSPAWLWKIDLDLKKKTKFDLYRELAHAPGEAIYVPGVTQQAMHESEAKVKQLVGGWRLGKSKGLAAELLPYLFIDNAHLWNVANSYDLGRPEFEYILQWLVWMGLKPDDDLKLSMPLTGKWSLRTPWGARLETMTAEDVTKLEAANLDACGVAEAGQIHLDVIHRLLGRVFQKGGPLLLSGSFEGSLPWYLEAFENNQNGGTDWHSFSAPSWENLIVFPGGYDDPKIQQQKNMLPEDVFLLKVAAKPVAPREIVFSEFDPKLHVVPMEFVDFSPYTKDRLEFPEPEIGGDGRVTKWYLPKKSTKGWELAIDPGYTGSYAVEFIQEWNGNVFIPAEIYLQYTVVEDVISAAKQEELWSQVRSGVIDVAGTQHQGMKSHQETWFDKKQAGVWLRSAKWPVEENIKRMRSFLINPMDKRPRLFIDPRCVGIIREFKFHRYPPPKESVPERERPIDKDNHGLKAVGYWLLDKFNKVDGDTQVVSRSYIGGAGRPAPSWMQTYPRYNPNNPLD